MLHVLKGFDVAASLQFLLKFDYSRDVLITAGQDHHWYRYVLGVYCVEKRWMTLRGCLEDGVGTGYERCDLRATCQYGATRKRKKNTDTFPPQQKPTMAHVLMLGFLTSIDSKIPPICGMMAFGAAFTEKKLLMYSTFSGVSGGYIEISAGPANQSGMNTLVAFPVL